MGIEIIFGILLIHWIADFVLQSDEEAKNKSTDSAYLLSHTSSYTVCWFVLGAFSSFFIPVDPLALTYFCFITLVAHTITDYFTSRLNSYLWKKGDSHNFFVSVGFDQILHYVQLILTYKLLF